MSDMSFRPVVALDLDGVLRIPAGEPGREIRDVQTVEITMRRATFPSYSHVEPPWNERGDWVGSHTFSRAGVTWATDLTARGVEVVWVSSWGAYTNVYFADPLGMPELPFMDGAVVVEDAADVSTARWLSRQCPRRPLLWVSAQAGPEEAAALRGTRAPADRSRTRVFNPDRFTGLTAEDTAGLDLWLEVVQSAEGQEELLRKERRRSRSRRSALLLERWGSHARYRRWRSARERLGAVLGAESVLLTLLADYVLERGSDVDEGQVSQLRDRWGRSADPPAEALTALMRSSSRRPAKSNILTWAGSGYPPGLGGILSRGHASGLRTLEVGRGWWPLLNALNDQLARIDPDYTLSNVRSTQGRLLFEARSSMPGWYAPAFRQLIQAGQRRATRTCERCGRPGLRRTDDRGRAAVLCDQHARPLTDEEISFALAGGVPPELVVGDGAIEGAVFADLPRASTD